LSGLIVPSVSPGGTGEPAFHILASLAPGGTGEQHHRDSRDDVGILCSRDDVGILCSA